MKQFTDMADASATTIKQFKKQLDFQAGSN